MVVLEEEGSPEPAAAGIQACLHPGGIVGEAPGGDGSIVGGECEINVRGERRALDAALGEDQLGVVGLGRQTEDDLVGTAGKRLSYGFGIAESVRVGPSSFEGLLDPETRPRTGASSES